MERLTKRVGKNITYAEPRDVMCSNYCSGCGKSDCKTIQDMIERLAYLEDLQEQGRLVELPCALGDEVYWFNDFSKNIHSGVVTSIKLSKFGFDLELLCGEDRIVKREFERVYLTKEEAEAALEGEGQDG